MKACYYEKYGSAADVLKIGDQITPEIKDDFDLIVKIEAAG